MVEVDPAEFASGVELFFQVQGQLATEAHGLVPLVPPQFAEVVARLSAFVEDGSGQAPCQEFSQFRLDYQCLLVVEVKAFHAAETLDSIGAGQHVEGNIAVCPLPQEAYGHGGFPEKVGESADVDGLGVEGVISQDVAVEHLLPLHQESVSAPVQVVSGV